MNTELHTLPLASIVLSQTAAQLERRAHFDTAAIAELAESINTVGLLQPLVVRPCITPRSMEYELSLYELVAGERRYLAAQRAGLTEIPCSVRDLSDEQVLEVQLVENLQRADLHELAEAEGYEALQQMGHSVEEIAAKVGKSKATVYSRCRLLTLGAEGREALRTGKISASTALLIARIPSSTLQEEALRQIVQPYAGAEAMSYREATNYVHSEFTLRLDQAPFSTLDAGLLPTAGSCNACPKRSGNQPELFSDIQRGDVCTDIDCFRLKRQAHAAAVLLAARASGKEVIEGAAADKIAPHGTQYNRPLTNGYVRLSATCHEDGKRRTYRELLGETAKDALLVDPASSDVIEVIRPADYAKQLKKLVAPHAKPTQPVAMPANREIDVKAQRQEKLHHRIYRAIFDASSSVLRDAAVVAAADTLKSIGYMSDVVEALGWDDFNMDAPAKELAKLSTAELARLLFVLPLCEELGGYGGESKRLYDAAKAAKVDVKKIEKQLTDEEAAAAAPTPKSAKKKAGKKPARKAK